MKNACGFVLSVSLAMLSGFALSSAQSPEPNRSTPARPFKIVRRSAEELQSTAIKRVDAVYPEAVQQLRESGSVVVDVFIDTLGNVTSARALSGPYEFFNAAVTAARGWKWEPTRQNGVPVNVSGTLIFKFEMEGGTPDSEEVKETKKAIVADPTSSEAYHSLGNALELSHRYEEAIAAFKEFIKLAPDDVGGYRRLAKLFDMLGRYKDSASAYARVLVLEPKSVDALHGLGYAQYTIGKYDDAIMTYMELLSIKPEDARAYYTLGLANFNKGYYREAIEAYTHSTQIKPPYGQLANVYRELGRACVKAEKLDDAVTAYRQAIAQDPSNEDGYLGLGLVFHQKRLYADAIVVYKQAISGHPSFARVRVNLAGALNAIGRPVEAIDPLLEALRINPDYSRGFVALADIYVLLGRFDEAIQNLQQSLRLEPNAPETFHHLGYAYYKAKLYEEAIDASTEVFKLNSKYEQAGAVYSTIAFAHLRLKRSDEAIDFAKKCVASKPTDLRRT